MYQDLVVCQKQGYKVKVEPALEWQGVVEWFVSSITGTGTITLVEDASNPDCPGLFRVINVSKIRRWHPETRTIEIYKE